MSQTNPSFEGLFYFGLERNVDRTLNIPAGEPDGKLEIVSSTLAFEQWEPGSKMYTIHLTSIDGLSPEGFNFSSIGGVRLGNGNRQIIGFQLNLHENVGLENKIVSESPLKVIHYLDESLTALESLFRHLSRLAEADPVTPAIWHQQKIPAGCMPQYN